MVTTPPTPLSKPPKVPIVSPVLVTYPKSALFPRVIIEEVTNPWGFKKSRVMPEPVAAETEMSVLEARDMTPLFVIVIVPVAFCTRIPVP